MKRIISLLLSLLMILSLAACTTPTAEPLPEPVATDAPQSTEPPALEPTTEPVIPDTPPADEFERAIWYGFVSEELSLADPQSIVTWLQYCQLLGNMIAAYDETLLAEWTSLTKDAPQTQIKRDGAMVSLLFAAKTMGLASFNARPPAEFEDYAPRVWDCVTMDYPIFDWDTPIDLGEGCSDNNHVGPSYDFCLRRVSLASGKSLLEFDQSGNLRLEQPLTLYEAALSAMRLFESERKTSSVEEAKLDTVSGEALTLGEEMPTVSVKNIPAWRGTSMALCDMLACHGRLLSKREDIAAFADMGFNYLRLMLLWTDFCEKSDDTLVFYPEVLENIDRIVEWCAEFNIHLCIDMHELPGYGFENRNILEDAAIRELSVLVWDVFSARYSDVPENLLSYNLVNEPDAGYFTDESYVAFANELIAVIQSNDNTSKLIVSDGMLDGNPDYGFAWSNACPTRTIAGLDSNIMQTIHLYPWHAAAKSGYVSLVDWPYENAEAVNNFVGEKPLTLRGSFPAGTRVTLHLDTVYELDSPLVCKAEGKTVASYERAFELDKGNCTFIGDGRAEFDIANHDGFVIDFTTSENSSEITVGGSFCVTDIFMRVPSDSQRTYPVPTNEKENGFYYETGSYDTVYIRTAPVWSEQTSSVIIAEDGSYTVENPAQGEVFDMEALRNYVEKWAAWSKETGTPIMCNEFGVPIGLPQEARIGYMRAVLNLFEEYNIPWCIYTNGLSCWAPVVTDSDVIAGSTILPADGSVVLRGTAWYDEPMLELFSEYMD